MSQKELGLYIHIPFCKQKCYYCDFPSYSGMEEYWEAYTDAVVHELVIKAGAFRQERIKSIFIGGGTPSLIPYADIARILDTVRSYYNTNKDCESTVESNPGTLTSEKLAAYRSAGINRLSLGLQACQDRLLKKLGRIHTFHDFKEAVNLAQTHGFENINADIIFGIPGQSFEEWRETIAQVLAINLTHISCYSLKIEEETVFGRMAKEGTLHEVEDEMDRQMYHYAINEFHGAGFDQYEISNFAKPQYRCKHNMNYWERGEYIGIGGGAHSFYQNRRYANTPDVLKYIEGVKKESLILSEDTTLSVEDGMAERIILGLRLNKGIDLALISKEFGMDMEKKYHKELAKLLSQKLVERDGTMIRLTKIGMDLANTVFIEFI